MLLQLLPWLHVLDYRNFRKMKDESLLIHNLALLNCFTYRSIFRNGANNMSKIMKMVNMVNDFLSKKLQILCSLDYSI